MVSTVISFAPPGMSEVVVLPPGQRTQIWVGVCGQPMTWTDAVLGPVARTAVDFPGGPHPRPKDQPHRRPDAVGIARRPRQPHPQTRLAQHVLVEPGLRPVLADRQVHTPVPVKIAQRRTPLLPVNQYARLLSRHRLQPPASQPAQPQTPTRVQSPPKVLEPE